MLSRCPLCAMCGRLRVGKENLHVAALVGCSHVCGLFALGGLTGLNCLSSVVASRITIRLRGAVAAVEPDLVRSMRLRPLDEEFRIERNAALRPGVELHHPAVAKNVALSRAPQMVEISRDRKRVYFTNSLYGSH